MSIDQALRQRYRQHDTPAPVADNATLHILLDHRSVRAYLPDPLAPGTIETLIAAAQSAPTSSNLQPWSVVAVQDPARKARLAALAGDQKHIVEAPLLLVWLIDFHRLTRIGEVRGTPPAALDYLESFVLGSVDASLAAQNAVVALESLGLGAVYIGGIRNRPAEVAAELGLPLRVFALFGLVVGRPDPARPAAVKPRLPQSAVLFHERYSPAEEQGAGAPDYDAALRAFQREQGLPERDWSDQALERTRGPESMAGRHVLRDVLHGMGFALR
jgi:nitroreductase